MTRSNRSSDKENCEVREGNLLSLRRKLAHMKANYKGRWQQMLAKLQEAHELYKTKEQNYTAKITAATDKLESVLIRVKR